MENSGESYCEGHVGDGRVGEGDRRGRDLSIMQLIISFLWRENIHRNSLLHHGQTVTQVCWDELNAIDIV